MQTSNTLLKISHLNISFPLGVYRSKSWRDLFTDFSKDPLKAAKTRNDIVHVARDISFEVKNGERIGLLGINGAGKTSICRAIAGMYRPNSGTIEMNGRVRAIFDTQVGILPELTGRENARLLVRFLFPHEDDTDSVAEEALAFSELGRFVDVPYKLYSNGMQARLCLSIISARPSDLLILDEVFDGADAYFREKASRRVLEMIERSGGVIFVSHSPDQIKRACKRVMVLEQGRIAYDGSVEGGLEYYQRACSRQATHKAELAF
jgi:ABC-type polysaccharide/polyol phosphate transport system ATPase subunit